MTIRATVNGTDYDLRAFILRSQPYGYVVL